MRRTKLLQELRKMRFEEAHEGWNGGRLSQFEAARLQGVCERTFRRYLARFEADGIDGLIDRRLEQVSHRRAPVDEATTLMADLPELGTLTGRQVSIGRRCTLQPRLRSPQG